MKSFAFHLQKGGVGKTSLSTATADFIARSFGKKTLLVDCDPQGNCSSWSLRETPAYELADALTGKVSLKEAVSDLSGVSLSILPTFAIGGSLKAYSENKLADEPFVFCDLLEELEKQGYEYVFFDLSPGMGRLERAVLTAAGYAVSVMTPDFFSLDGIEIFSGELQLIRKNMRRSALHKIIAINAYDARIKQHREIMGKVRLLTNYAVFVVPVDPVFRKMQAERKPIALGDAKKETSAGIEALAKSLMEEE